MQFILNQPSYFHLIFSCNLHDFLFFQLDYKYIQVIFFIWHLLFEVENRSLKGKDGKKKSKIIPYHCAYSTSITIMVLDIDTFRLYFYKIDTHTHTISIKTWFLWYLGSKSVEISKKSDIGTRLVSQNFDIGPTLHLIRCYSPKAWGILVMITP